MLTKVVSKTRRMVVIAGIVCLWMTVAVADDKTEDHDKSKNPGTSDSKSSKSEATSPEPKLTAGDILKKWKELDPDKATNEEFVAKLEAQLAKNALTNAWADKNEGEAHWKEVGWFRENFSVENLEKVIASPREYGVESASALKMLKALLETAKQDPGEVFTTALDESVERDPTAVAAAKRELERLQKNPDELKRKLQGMNPEQLEKFNNQISKLGKYAGAFGELLEWAKQAVSAVREGKPIKAFHDVEGDENGDPALNGSHEGHDSGGGSPGRLSFNRGGRSFSEEDQMIPHSGGTTIDLEDRFRQADGRSTEKVITNKSKATKGSEFVRDCKENVPEGKSFEWGKVPELCRDPACPRHGSNRIGGKVSMKKNNEGKKELVLEVPKIQFIYPNEPGLSKERMDKVDGIMKCVANFFAERVGVDRVIFNVEHNPIGNLKSTDPVIRIDPSEGRSNCNLFHLGNPPSTLCPVMTHELLHRIAGLPDRYIDGECPGRNPQSGYFDDSNIGPLSSIMATNTFNSRTKLEPDHEKALLRGLCTKLNDPSVPVFCQRQ